VALEICGKFFFCDLRICNLWICDLWTPAFCFGLKTSASPQLYTFYPYKIKNYFKKMTFTTVSIQGFAVFGISRICELRNNHEKFADLWIGTPKKFADLR
jgi:hypothetical protein